MTVIDVKNSTVMKKVGSALANLLGVNFSIHASEGPVLSFFINNVESKMLFSLGSHI